MWLQRLGTPRQTPRLVLEADASEAHHRGQLDRLMKRTARIPKWPTRTGAGTLAAWRQADLLLARGCSSLCGREAGVVHIRPAFR